MSEQGITVFVCGGKRCEHAWDGPQVELTQEEHGMNGGTRSCSKCGELAINVSMMEGM